MAKMRGIKPEFWTDGAVASLSPLARLLFIGMWHYCCDNGHLMAKPRDLKIRLLPLDNCDVEELLAEIVNVDPESPLVVKDGDGYTVPNLRKHQQIHARWETKCQRCPNGGPTVAGNGGTTVDNGGATGDHGPSPDEVNRSEVKGSEVKGKRGSRLPDDFHITADMRTWAASKTPGLNIDAETERFCDYWRAASGARGVKADWTATWRNWMRKAAQDRKPVVSPRDDWMRA